MFLSFFVSFFFSAHHQLADVRFERAVSFFRYPIFL